MIFRLFLPLPNIWCTLFSVPDKKFPVLWKKGMYFISSFIKKYKNHNTGFHQSKKTWNYLERADYQTLLFKGADVSNKEADKNLNLALFFVLSKTWSRYLVDIPLFSNRHWKWALWSKRSSLKPSLISTLIFITRFLCA